MLTLLAVILAHGFVGLYALDTDTMSHTTTFDTMQQCKEVAVDTQVCVAKQDGGAYLFSE